MDAVIIGVVMLLGIAATFALGERLNSTQKTQLGAGAVGATGGIAIGYSVGGLDRETSCKPRQEWRSFLMLDQSMEHFRQSRVTHAPGHPHRPVTAGTTQRSASNQRTCHHQVVAGTRTSGAAMNDYKTAVTAAADSSPACKAPWI